MKPRRRMMHVIVSSVLHPVMRGGKIAQLADTMPEVTAGTGIGAGFGMGQRTCQMIGRKTLRATARHIVSGRVREGAQRTEPIMKGRAPAAPRRHRTTRAAGAHKTTGRASGTHQRAVTASLRAAILAAD
jgi:hypothetical protein